MFEKLTAKDFGTTSYLCPSRKQCLTKAQARQAAAKRSKEHGVRIYYYKCQIGDCPWWHLTSSENRAPRGDPKSMGGRRSRR